MEITYTRVELEREPAGSLAYQKSIDGRPVEIVRAVPAGYCGHCGDRLPVAESCGCFDNGCE